MTCLAFKRKFNENFKIYEKCIFVYFCRHFSLLTTFVSPFSEEQQYANHFCLSNQCEWLTFAYSSLFRKKWKFSEKSTVLVNKIPEVIFFFFCALKYKNFVTMACVKRVFAIEDKICGIFFTEKYRFQNILR